MHSVNLLWLSAAFLFPAACHELGRSFRFEPFAPYTGSEKGFYPHGRGKEEATTLYTAATFPSPFVEPERCNFSSRQTHSWFCDPEKLLSPLDQAELESALLRVRDEREHVCADGRRHHFQMAVAVLPDIFVPEGKSLQEASDEMAYQLLRNWGVGNKPCHDGLLLMLVKNHLIWSLVGRENVVPEYISPMFVSFLRTRLGLVYLTSGSVSAAVIHAVDLVGSQLPRAPTGIGWVAYLLLGLIISYVISVVVVYVALSYSLGKRFQEGD